MKIIECESLRFEYKVGGESVPILRGLTFSIEAGECVGIQGPSGSGKSTLLYLLGCLMRPNAGQLKILGTDIAQLSAHELALLRGRQIGFVFQQFHLLQHTSVFENVLLPAYYGESLPSGAEVTRAQSLIAMVGLEEKMASVPNQLSGGQQQRVAIARALYHAPSLILADEPTGNLDSKSSRQILDQLLDLNRKGHTVVIITHDSYVASLCDRVLHIEDGLIVRETRPEHISTQPRSEPVLPLALPANRRPKAMPWRERIRHTLREFRKTIPTARENLMRNRLRTVLTMLGIVIGIASLLTMVTLGQFTKTKILESYADLGVNTLTFRGYRNWDQKATDRVPTSFQGFDWNRDIEPLYEIFPEIQRLSPVIMNWDGRAVFGGKVVDTDVRIIGVNETALGIAGRKTVLGNPFSAAHVNARSFVCVIGREIATELFPAIDPIGQVLMVGDNTTTYGYHVLGVLEPMSSNSDWMKPNRMVYMPYTTFQAVAGQARGGTISDLMIQVNPAADVQRTGDGIQRYFEARYGKSGRFRVGYDSKLVQQMNKILTLFTILLAAIAMVALGVGGIGITNMMLVSVAERYREIGIRKAVGATDEVIRIQFMSESVVVCALAGAAGLGIGFVAYEAVIAVASAFVPRIPFAWVVDPWAVALSMASIVTVGVLSGLAPAIRAEKLQVVEALRAE